MGNNIFIHSIVLKIASRCNINCTYCYMYNMGDTSYLTQPKAISEKTIDQLCVRIKEHCEEHDVKVFNIYLHGGEPLLVGKKKFVKIIEQFKKLENDHLKIQLSIQTNGILVDEEWCDIFLKYSIIVGISLDGNKEFNDLNRLDHKGEGTYDRVVKGIDICRSKLKNHPFGILTVLNIESDPVEAYEHFKQLGILGADFLLLDQNYDHFDKNNIDKSASWLINVFDNWIQEKDYFSIRFFEVIIRSILGGAYNVDLLGSSTNNVLVIETNGGIEAVDVLKICGESFTKNSLNIFDNNFNEAFNNDLAKVYYNSGNYLPKKCLACPVNAICGGGFIAHRYSSKNGFNNPSVYCDDLLKLITYIQNKTVDEMPESLRKETGIEKLTYEEANQIIEDTLPLIPEPNYVELLESFRKKEYA